MSGVGWGSSAWGAGPWGGALDASLLLLEAVASRENAVQLVFNHPVMFTGLGDVTDGAEPSHYSFVPVAGTRGLDGTAARAVTAVGVTVVSPVPEGVLSGAVLEVTLDRPMTAYPSVYTVACAGLVAVDGTPLADVASTFRFQGCFKEIVVPQVEHGHPMRDLANPQTKGALVATSPSALLGSYAVDASGDYAFDQGLDGYKKRIVRRGVTRPGGFVHLGDKYGVGITQAGKKLARPGVVASFAAEYEKQIGAEPETERVRVTSFRDPAQPGLVFFRIATKPKVGQPTQFNVPFPVR